MGLVRGQSLMVIMYCGNALLLFTCKLQCTNILTGLYMLGYYTLLVYKISDLYLFQFLRYILGFKLKKKKKKKNGRNGLFAISPMLMVQFKPQFR